MATESVELIVGAKDNASAVLSKAASSQKQYENALKDTADTSARSTAALAIMLQAMGGSELGQMASGVMLVKAGLDSLRAAEAENASGFEKMAAKAGLLFAAFQTGFKIGEFFSGAKQAAEKLNKEMERSKYLIGLIDKARGRRISDDQFELSLIKNPDAQISQLKKLIDRAEKEVSGANKNAESARSSFEVYNTWENNWLRINKSIQIAEKERWENAKANAEKYRDELASLQTQLERAQKTQSLEESRKQSEQIREQIELTKKAAEEEAKRQEALQKAVEAQAQKDEGYLNGLREQLILLRDGSAAAQQFKDAQAGIGSAAIKEGQEYRRQIELLTKRNELQQKAKQITEANLTPLQRFRKDYEELAKLQVGNLISGDTFSAELSRLKKRLTSGAGGNNQIQQRAQLAQESSRFLSRARGSDPIQQQTENSKKQVELLTQAKKVFDQVNQKLSSIQTNTAKQPKVLS